MSADVSRSTLIVDDDAVFRNVVVLAIPLEIETDRGIFGNTNVFIQDDFVQVRAPADIAVVQNDALVNHRARMDPDPSAEHGIPDHTAGQEAATGDDAVDRLAAPVVLIESEFSRRIGIAYAAHRPFAVIEIERRLNRA